MKIKFVYDVWVRYFIYWKLNFIRGDFRGESISRRKGSRLYRENFLYANKSWFIEFWVIY